MNVLGIIPARYGSTRFPGKPLALINGKSMINRVYEQAGKSGLLNHLVVATDDERILNHVSSFGGNCLMTSKDHPNGTSRCLEVFNSVSRSGEKIFDVIINIQGDEPFIDPGQIDRVIRLMQYKQVQIGTLIKKINNSKELVNYNVVKVVTGNEGKALYFSRQPVPFIRDLPQAQWSDTGSFYKHIGIYAYRAEVLQKIVELPVGKLESAEKLEQLRWLENNYQVYTDVTESEGVAIDIPEDLLKINNID